MERGRVGERNGGVGKILYYNHQTRALDRYVQRRSMNREFPIIIFAYPRNLVRSRDYDGFSIY